MVLDPQVPHLARPYPASEPSRTPPRYKIPSLPGERSPSPPTSPTPHERTQPGPPLEDITSNPPMDEPMPFADQSPPTPTPRANPAPLSTPQQPTPQGPPSPSPLQTNPHAPITTTGSMRAHLEKVSLTNSQLPGCSPARNPLDKYTLGPMPNVQDASPTAVFENIDLDCISKWEDIEGEKLLAIPFNTPQRTMGWHGTIAGKILTAVAEITKAKEVDVCEPRPSEEATKICRTPIAFLIHSISSQQAEILMERKIWSSQAITFHTTCFAPVCPNFLFTIKGWKTITLKNIFPVIKQVWESEQARDFVRSLVYAVPPAQRSSVEKEVDTLLASLNIIHLDTKEMGNTLTPRFNVYADSSKLSLDEVWSRLRAHYANCTYASTTLGKGLVEQTPFRCTLCHGVDHPRGLCPFPDTPEWNGPTRDGDRERRNMRARGSDPWGQRGQFRY